MKKLIFGVGIVLAAPAVANERTIINALPSEYVGNVNITNVDVILREAAIPTTANLDNRAENRLRQQEQSDKSLPSLDSRKSYATMPTVLMLSEVMTDRFKKWNVSGTRDVKLVVTLETLKLADKSNIVFGKPYPIPGGGVAKFLLSMVSSDDDNNDDFDYEDDTFAGSEDEIAGLVDVYESKSNLRIGSYYIDIFRKYEGLIPIPSRGPEVREKLGEAFTAAVASCLTSTTCITSKDR
jgi:hypothetical protein